MPGEFPDGFEIPARNVIAAPWRDRPSGDHSSELEELLSDVSSSVAVAVSENAH